MLTADDADSRVYRLTDDADECVNDVRRDVVNAINTEVASIVMSRVMRALFDVQEFQETVNDTIESAVMDAVKGTADDDG